MELTCGVFSPKFKKNATQFCIYIYMKLCRTLVNATHFRNDLDENPRN